MAEAYPLHWPVGYPRTRDTQRSRFANVALDLARKELRHELRLLGATNVVISTNFPLRSDGELWASAPRGGISDHGVAVYFTLNKEPMVLCCDRWDKIEHNIVAVAKTIDAMRGMDRWGVSDMIKRAFTGFKALPEQTSAESWHSVLGISPKASKDDIVQAYRNLVKIHHPDAGGNADHFKKISEAYQQGLKQTA